MISSPDLAAALAAAARSSHAPSAGLEATLQRIVEVARDSVPGFDHAGISTMHSNGELETRAATGQLVYDLDEVQYDLGEGPCVEALQDASVVVAPRIGLDQRWPRYARAATDAGLRSQLAVKVCFDDEGTLGGLNLYSTTHDEVDPSAHLIADLFAAHAAVALSTAREREMLSQALETRRLVGQATGIVMERFDMAEGPALDYLARAAAQRHVKMGDVARDLVTQRRSERAASLDELA